MCVGSKQVTTGRSVWSGISVFYLCFTLVWKLIFFFFSLSCLTYGTG